MDDVDGDAFRRLYALGFGGEDDVVGWVDEGAAGGAAGPAGISILLLLGSFFSLLLCSLSSSVASSSIFRFAELRATSIASSSSRSFGSTGSRDVVNRKEEYREDEVPVDWSEVVELDGN
jgi:hypothetical protein